MPGGLETGREFARLIHARRVDRTRNRIGPGQEKLVIAADSVGKASFHDEAALLEEREQRDRRESMNVREVEKFRQVAGQLAEARTFQIQLAAGLEKPMNGIQRLPGGRQVFEHVDEQDHVEGLGRSKITQGPMVHLSP